MKSRLILIFAGLAFFFNPCFNLFDILPDFLGAALIMCGLGSFAYFDANFESAYKSAKFLLWISVLKFALCVWCNTGHRDYVMPFTFVVAVLETIFMISMFRGLYLGAEYTLMRSTSEQTPKSVNEAFTMSFVFTVVGRILEFAPHVADIVEQDAELDLSHNASFKMPMAQMKVYLFGTCLIFGLIIGVVYLAVTSKTLIKLIRDMKYNEFLREKYEDFLVNEREVYVTKKISLAYTLLTASIIFIPDFYVDAVNLIPGVITVFCLLGASGVMCGLGKKRMNIFFFAACFASMIVNAIYMSKVHLGINYVYLVETFNRKEFPFLQSGMSVVCAVIFCLLEAVLTWGAFGFLFNTMKGVFVKERRRNVLARLFGMRILSAFALCLTALSRVLTTVCGHLATNPQVTDYIRNKAFITSGAVYESMMANPNIQRYENYVSFQSFASMGALACVLIMLVVTVNMMRATEGNSKDGGL